MIRSRTNRVAILIYVISLGVYAATSGMRLLRPSNDNHFSYQAHMLLHGRLDLGRAAPQNMNDWAEVDVLHLKDGRTLEGAYLRSQSNRFRQLGGKVESIDATEIASRQKEYYVSFPPFPALLFLPFVALFGLHFNDVLFTVVLAALGPTLLFLVLRRLAVRRDSLRTEQEDLLLTAMFGVGTVYYYASVLGQVWYTAHIVATVLTGLFVLASLEASHPLMAGLFLGGMVLTRPQMGFWGLFFLYELRRSGRPALSTLVRLAIPLVLLGGLGGAFNWARFHSLSEFGHTYLNVRWTDRIQRYGLFNYAFLARNLTCAFTLTPKLLSKAPYLQVSWHGMSMLLTTPALLYLLWPKEKSTLHTALWLVVAPIALLSFLYQNDGWVQFGYRFSIDYLFALIMLLAIGGRPLSRTFQVLVIFGVAVNLFGAITFGRMWQFYHDGFFPIPPGEL
jgi:hypothetical protein